MPQSPGITQIIAPGSSGALPLNAALFQQMPNVLQVIGPLPQGNGAADDARPKKAKRKLKAAAPQVRALQPPAAADRLTEPATPDETAARQLEMARELVQDADTAEEHGETDRAARLRQRTRERLEELVERYPTTTAADDARDLLKKLGG
jgi:hypothetical protein